MHKTRPMTLEHRKQRAYAFQKAIQQYPHVKKDRVWVDEYGNNHVFSSYVKHDKYWPAYFRALKEIRAKRFINA